MFGLLCSTQELLEEFSQEAGTRQADAQRELDRESQQLELRAAHVAADQRLLAEEREGIESAIGKQTEEFVEQEQALDDAHRVIKKWGERE